MEEINSLMQGFSVALTIIICCSCSSASCWGADRRVAQARRRQRRGDPAAAHVHDVPDQRDHHVVLYLLGRIVRRRDHVHPVQYTGRAVVGGDHLRRPPDGQGRPRQRGPDRGVHVLVRRR